MTGYWIIGHFKPNGRGFSGHIRFITARLDNVEIRRMDKGEIVIGSGKNDDYMVFIDDMQIGFGRDVIGAQARVNYMDFELHDPTWPLPLRLRLFRETDTDFQMVWLR